MFAPESNGAVKTPSNLPVGTERLLGVSDVCELTGLAEATAAKVMKESGRCVRVHSRLYILESSFFAYVRELEASQPCSL